MKLKYNQLYLIKYHVVSKGVISSYIGCLPKYCLMGTEKTSLSGYPAIKDYYSHVLFNIIAGPADMVHSNFIDPTKPPIPVFEKIFSFSSWKQIEPVDLDFLPCVLNWPWHSPIIEDWLKAGKITFFEDNERPVRSQRHPLCYGLYDVPENSLYRNT